MRSLLRRLAFGIVGLALTGSLARVRAGVPPLSYLTGHGARATPVVALTWGVLIISVAVTVIIAVLLAAALWRRRSKVWQPGERLDVSHPHGAMWWVWVGVAISTLVLLGTCVWTMLVLAQIASPAKKAPFIVEITGRQWWWEVHYASDAAHTFSTANEIHIPTGVPVAFELIGGDVIHSFWIPQLGGKTDTIPGQTNEMWLEAHKPGTYYGQCTEYCGVQHAHMKMLLIAQAPADFARWWADQIRLASPPNTAQARAGLAAFTVHCGSCHSVRGTDAAGVFGPDLSHLMTRQTIAAGTLPNSTGYLSGWIADPQAMKPGNLMPQLELTGPELADIRAYLQTLK